MFGIRFGRAAEFTGAAKPRPRAALDLQELEDRRVLDAATGMFSTGISMTKFPPPPPPPPVVKVAPITAPPVSTTQMANALAHQAQAAAQTVSAAKPPSGSPARPASSASTAAQMTTYDSLGTSRINLGSEADVGRTVVTVDAKTVREVQTKAVDAARQYPNLGFGPGRTASNLDERVLKLVERTEKVTVGSGFRDAAGRDAYVREFVAAVRAGVVATPTQAGGPTGTALKGLSGAIPTAGLLQGSTQGQPLAQRGEAFDKHLAGVVAARAGLVWDAGHPPRGATQPPVTLHGAAVAPGSSSGAAGQASGLVTGGQSTASGLWDFLKTPEGQGQLLPSDPGLEPRNAAEAAGDAAADLATRVVDSTQAYADFVLRQRAWAEVAAAVPVGHQVRGWWRDVYKITPGPSGLRKELLQTTFIPLGPPARIPPPSPWPSFSAVHRPPALTQPAQPSGWPTFFDWATYRAEYRLGRDGQPWLAEVHGTRR